MGGKKKKNKRKKSDDSVDNKSFCKAGRFSHSPDFQNVPVSNILSQANSVLFENEDQLNLKVLFEGNSSIDSDTDTGPDTGPFLTPHPPQDLMVTMENPSNCDIMNCLKGIDNKLMNIDSRLKKLEILERKVDKFDEEMKKLWNFVHDNAKKVNERLDQVEDKVEASDFSVGLVNDKVIELQREKDLLRDEVVYLQSQSMRNNLIFTNIEEAPTETPDDTEKTLRSFLTNKMKLAQKFVDDLQFERVHRIGAKTNHYSRKIVAKFSLFKEREYVRKQWKSLQGSNYFVQEQFPKEVNDIRRKLIPKLKEAKQAGKRAWLAYDTLYIDGKPMKGDESS
ncbi:uncharacterized protein LOC132733999 [Ruditapes philippinarum]|uniref:uncharacterized protein LOC132733999 n=1 Tax=Ruditapes philippinarum TaxID=129788 RepID=UPI00295AD1FD|nr:uncharacterized protein LOC132733999 [Ruditapes philippinarum]